jgi:hypothetical protein
MVPDIRQTCRERQGSAYLGFLRQQTKLIGLNLIREIQSLFWYFRYVKPELCHGHYPGCISDHRTKSILPSRIADLSLFGKRQNSNGSRSLDGHRQFTLMRHAVTGDPARHDSTPFGQKVPQQSHILEVNGDFFIAEPTHTPTLKKPSTATAARASTPACSTIPSLVHHYTGSSYSYCGSSVGADSVAASERFGRKVIV